MVVVEILLCSFPSGCFFYFVLNFYLDGKCLLWIHVVYVSCPNRFIFCLKFVLLSIEALEPRPLWLELNPFEWREIIPFFGKRSIFNLDFFLAQLSLLALWTWIHCSHLLYGCAVIPWTSKGVPSCRISQGSHPESVEPLELPPGSSHVSLCLSLRHNSPFSSLLVI